MPRLPFIIVVVAAVLIVAGRVGRRNAWNAGKYRHAELAGRFTLDADRQAESAG